MLDQLPLSAFYDCLVKWVGHDLSSGWKMIEKYDVKQSIIVRQTDRKLNICCEDKSFASN